MNRRHFHWSLATSLGGAALLSSHSRLLAEKEESDRYGGWTGKTFEATGFFRAEKDGRWWLVTPEGNAFLSFGINHFTPSLFQQPHNASIWQKKLGIENVKDQSQLQPALKNWFLEICQEYGFNTVGVHNSLQVINRPKPAMPYMQPIQFVETPHWKSEIPDENFVDVFSIEFANHCDRLAKEIAAPLRDDPFLLGYSMTDCTLFTEEDLRERPDVIGGARRKSRIGWPRRLRSLGADAPGKQAYVDLMRRLYREDIEAFNTTYGTRFDTFDALASATNWRPYTDLSNANETRDNIVFLQGTAQQQHSSATLSRSVLETAKQL
ncbi:MAG: hypothetical protein AAF357_12635, partial [Verrucomicrobiota bacterium]